MRKTRIRPSLCTLAYMAPVLLLNIDVNISCESGPHGTNILLTCIYDVGLRSKAIGFTDSG